LHRAREETVTPSVLEAINQYEPPQPASEAVTELVSARDHKDRMMIGAERSTPRRVNDLVSVECGGAAGDQDIVDRRVNQTPETRMCDQCLPSTRETWSLPPSLS
jgi:hypothetical protein